MTEASRAAPATRNAQLEPISLAAGSAGGLAMALARAVRPRQWVKNVLVLAAPAAAGALVKPDVAAGAALAVVAFCLVASATYLMNDLADRDDDRRHPVKATRPIAAGLVSTALAATTGLVLLVTGLAIGSRTGLGLVGVLAVYAAINVAYCLVLRRVAVVDLGAVASGFVIRVLAGGVATGVPVSRWLLIVASFGALFVVALPPVWAPPVWPSCRSCRWRWWCSAMGCCWRPGRVAPPRRSSSATVPSRRWACSGR
jgi:heme O synthase-like polyprenyltransferase